ncbi:HET-domain-containing protein [Xylariaceae sp. AK1471]|nr:HET-domain-containing protein [Xylariaceae sp. AK1471]
MSLDERASGLCHYCTQIPLDISPPKVFGEWSLGTLGRVRQSKCKLCRLIRFVLYEAARTALSILSDPDIELTLRWTRHPGYFTLGASSIIDPTSLALGVSSIKICYVRNPDTDCRIDEAFYLTPNVGQTIDFQRIKAWVGQCKDKHVENCKMFRRAAHYGKLIQDSYPELDLLRFIDVRDRCIVETKTISPYVALSYVWGTAVNLRLTTSNKAELTQPGALHHHRTRIPRTISDAMFLAREIGERYLWCDALCLVQNDPDDLNRGVKMMDLIYENAELTIVAACGHDANAGLPGIRKDTRFKSRFNKEIIPGVRLGCFVSLSQRMKHSLYNSRAWTFQEDLLSARCLFLIDELVYFRCRSSTLFEFFDPGLDNYTGEWDNEVTLLPGTIKMDDPIVDFQNMLLYYGQRALTNQQDTLNAMGGIIQRLSRRMKCRFLEGLPTASFDLMIPFRCFLTVLHRRRGFPSYSWAGWRGSLDWPSMPDAANEWLETSTWIVWYKRSTHGALNLVWDILANEDFPYGNYEYVGYRKRRPFNPPVALPFPTGRIRPTEELGHSLPVLNYQVLQFWTLSAFFNIRIVDNIESFALVIGKSRTTCGALYLDDLEGSVFFESAGSYELIAISATTIDLWEDRKSILNDVVDSEGFLDTDCYYTVMVLKWCEGLAERRGIGLVRQKDFITESLAPGVCWKEILLG